MSIGATETTSDPLERLERLWDMVRDRVRSVVYHHDTGLYLYGAGGLGKSHTVLQELAVLEVSYRLHNTRLTAKGLFHELQKAPDVIHVMDDVEYITSDKIAQSVLRAACWAQPGHPRRLT
jgi:hypothetical protein